MTLDLRSGMTRLVSLFTSNMLPLYNEKTLQGAMANLLTAACIPFDREVRLDPEGRDIVDFMAGAEKRIGIEVKIGGSRRAIFRQCERYCAHDRVGGILLATNVAMALPVEINGKPTSIAHLGLGWL